MARSSLLLASAPAAFLLASLVASPQAQAAANPAAPTTKPAPKEAAPAVKPAAPVPKRAPAPPAPVALIPKAWERSIYDLEGRVVTVVDDVTFEAPPAYQESFAFWTGRMKGGQRTELLQLLTTTREPAEDGSLPFRRQVSRFQVDIVEQGQNKTPAGQLSHLVTSLVWEGVLDPEGNVRDITKTGGPDDTSEFEQLSFELLDRLFPRLGERREMKPGDSFTEKMPISMPQRLAVKGLEGIGLIVTRAFTLREVRGNEAIFDVKVTYEADPATPPTAPRTTCAISGSGTGQATFDRADGLFIQSKMESRMVIDLEAPLRRLPDQPEGFDPGTAKSRIALSLQLSGKQVLARLFTEPAEEPAAD